MTKRTRNILLIVAAVLSVVAGIFGYGIYSLYSFFSQMNVEREMPDEIKEARILKGSDFLAKQEFFKINHESLINTIGKSATIKDEKERQKAVSSQVGKGIYNFSDLRVLNNQIIAVSEFGGYVFDLDGNLSREILFEPVKEKIKIGWFEKDNYQSNLSNLQIVELEKNKFGFLSYGGTQGVSVFDENGNRIWNYGKQDLDMAIIWEDEKKREERHEKSVYVMEAAVGDLDNDGISEYIVTVKNDGTHVFDRNGKEKWFQPDEFPSDKIYVLDIDGNGKNEMLQLGNGSKVKDEKGNTIKEFKGGGRNDFLLATKNKNVKSLLFCDAHKNKFSCRDTEDKTILETEAPLSEIKLKDKRKIDVPNHPEMSFTEETESVAYPKAVWVNLQKDKPKYLAVVASFIGRPRSDFYVYDEKGNLVYHELLPEEAETIAVKPAANSTEEILIGGKDTIWKFAAK